MVQDVTRQRKEKKAAQNLHKILSYQRYEDILESIVISH